MTDQPFEAWQLWYADVKFEDSDEIKRRPVVILKVDNIEYVCVVLKVTSKDKPNNIGYRIKKWKEAGLSKESIVILRPFRIDQTRMVNYIGVLQNVDVIAITDLLRRKDRYSEF